MLSLIHWQPLPGRKSHTHVQGEIKHDDQFKIQSMSVERGGSQPAMSLSPLPSSATDNQVKMSKESSPGRRQESRGHSGLNHRAPGYPDPAEPCYVWLDQQHIWV